MHAPPWRGTQIRVVLEDPLVEINQQGARFEPELMDQPATSMSVCLECLDLTARLVERKHQLAHQPLAERIGIGCSLQFGYELVATAELELRVCPRLERTKPFLLERRKLSAEGVLPANSGRTSPRHSARASANCSAATGGFPPSRARPALATSPRKRKRSSSSGETLSR